MPQENMANLNAYLKRMETDIDPGITETCIVLGTVLPEETALNGLVGFASKVRTDTWKRSVP